MRTKYKPWAKPYLDEHQEVQMRVLDVIKLSHIHLEIGSGKGAFLCQMAKKYPDKFFIGLEKNLTCAGMCAKALVEQEIENAKILFIDGEDLMKEMKDESVSILYLNFSDPWPKKRHEKRRLTSEKFIDEYLRILEVGGEIRFKSDNDELYAFTKEAFNNPAFEIILDEENYDGLDENDVPTEYELKKRSAGFNIHKMIVRKK